MKSRFALVCLAAAAACLVGAGQSRATSASCLAHHPQYIENVIEVQYSTGCTGHDEPELDPLSTLPGSGSELTWTAVLPSNGAFNVDATGPTFWFGGTVTDPIESLRPGVRRAPVLSELDRDELQPERLVHSEVLAPAPTPCARRSGASSTSGTPGNFHEPAAFNAMLTTPGSTSAMVMHAGDTVKVHWFTTAAQDGYHVTVTDVDDGAGRARSS